MFDYSPFRFPYNRSRYYNYGYNNYNNQVNAVKEVINIDSQKKEAKSKQSDELFQIFGLTLHFDDILLLCLILFLYTDGITDEWLFLSLVLLLLT